MKIAYFDCFSGVSGDMTLAALLACGADETAFRDRLDALNVPGYELRVRRVTREGITATDVDVHLIEAEQGHGRHLSDIAAILDSSPLPPRVRQNALAVFTRLADAEAKIHGTTREQIHFHEVGAVDAIVDIVGSCLLLDMLGVERIVTSSIPCGHGTIKCQHGIMPVPAPATMELLQGFPVHSVDIRGETRDADRGRPADDAGRPGNRRKNAYDARPDQRLRGGQEAVQAGHAEPPARHSRRNRRGRAGRGLDAPNGRRAGNET